MTRPYIPLGRFKYPQIYHTFNCSSAFFSATHSKSPPYGARTSLLHMWWRIFVLAALYGTYSTYSINNVYPELMLASITIHVSGGRDGRPGVQGDSCTKSPPLQSTELANCARNFLAYKRPGPRNLLLSLAATSPCCFVFCSRYLGFCALGPSRAQTRFHYSVAGISLA